MDTWIHVSRARRKLKNSIFYDKFSFRIFKLSKLLGAGGGGGGKKLYVCSPKYVQGATASDCPMSPRINASGHSNSRQALGRAGGLGVMYATF